MESEWMQVLHCPACDGKQFTVVSNGEPKGETEKQLRFQCENKRCGLKFWENDGNWKTKLGRVE